MPADAVAEESAAASAAATTAAAAETWLEVRLAVEELSEAGDTASALALEGRLIELVTAEFGPEGTQLADAHRLLAEVHRQNGNFQLAEEQLLTAIEVLERRGGPVAEELIDPFLDLGDTYNESGDFSAAISAYGEARTIGRRAYGLLNEDQLRIVDLMTAAAESLGDIEEARNLQLEALTLIERLYEPSSHEALEARYKYAGWLRNHRLYDEERRLYYQIQRVIRDHYDDDPVMHIRALRERARSYRQADNGDSLGLSGLTEARDLLEEMDDPPALLMAEVLTDIGDWQVEFSRTRSIGDEYLQAWQLLDQVENGDQLRAEWFDDLYEVELPTLSQRGLSSDPADPPGFVVVYFTVDTAGRTRDIEITDSEPPGLKDGAVARLMRLARFRPRIMAGSYVPTRRAYRFEFRYQPTAEINGN